MWFLRNEIGRFTCEIMWMNWLWFIKTIQNSKLLLLFPGTNEKRSKNKKKKKQTHKRKKKQQEITRAAQFLELSLLLFWFLSDLTQWIKWSIYWPTIRIKKLRNERRKRIEIFQLYQCVNRCILLWHRASSK